MEKGSIGRRMSKAVSRVREWMMEYAYLVTLGAVLAIVVASAMATQHSRMLDESDIQAAAGAPEIEQTPQPQKEGMTLATLAPVEIHYSAPNPGGGTVWPLSGAILRNYEIQTPVFWEALGCLQVHKGLDIAGEAEEDVLCVMDGVVQETVRDELWGWRVRIAQTNGQEAEYKGLLQCAVSVGQSVTRGQSLGVLLERIPCEAELETHLHLELIDGKETCDPIQILPEKK